VRKEDRKRKSYIEQGVGNCLCLQTKRNRVGSTAWLGRRGKRSSCWSAARKRKRKKGKWEKRRKGILKGGEDKGREIQQEPGRRHCFVVSMIDRATRKSGSAGQGRKKKKKRMQEEEGGQRRKKVDWRALSGEPAKLRVKRGDRGKNWGKNKRGKRTTGGGGKGNRIPGEGKRTVCRDHRGTESGSESSD